MCACVCICVLDMHAYIYVHVHSHKDVESKEKVKWREIQESRHICVYKTLHGSVNVTVMDLTLQ